MHQSPGVLVVSPTALERPWVQQEYAAMMTRTVAGEQRLIPVLLEDANMPPMLASRLWVDFRKTDGPVYTAKLQELARALKGERRGAPPRTSALKPPPETGFHAEGPLQCRLQISLQAVEFSGGDDQHRATPGSPDAALEQRLWELDRARHHPSPESPDMLRGQGSGRLETLLEQVGEHLSQAFLPPPVAEALTAAVAEATRLNCPLELALDVTDEALINLPWETLRLPGLSPPTLALHPRVDLYRITPTGGAVPAVNIPGPLADKHYKRTFLAPRRHSIILWGRRACRGPRAAGRG